MTTRTRTEPQYDYICDRCGKIETTPGGAPKGWIRFSPIYVSGVNTENTYPDLCLACAAEWQKWWTRLGTFPWIPK